MGLKMAEGTCPQDWSLVGWLFCFIMSLGLAASGADSPILLIVIISGWGFLITLVSAKEEESVKNG